MTDPTIAPRRSSIANRMLTHTSSPFDVEEPTAGAPADPAPTPGDPTAPAGAPEMGDMGAPPPPVGEAGVEHEPLDWDEPLDTPLGTPTVSEAVREEGGRGLTGRNRRLTRRVGAVALVIGALALGREMMPAMGGAADGRGAPAGEAPTARESFGSFYGMGQASYRFALAAGPAAAGGVEFHRGARDGAGVMLEGLATGVSDPEARVAFLATATMHAMQHDDRAALARLVDAMNSLDPELRRDYRVAMALQGAYGELATLQSARPEVAERWRQRATEMAALAEEHNRVARGRGWTRETRAEVTGVLNSVYERFAARTDLPEQYREGVFAAMREAAQRAVYHSGEEMEARIPEAPPEVLRTLRAATTPTRR